MTLAGGCTTSTFQVTNNTFTNIVSVSMFQFNACVRTSCYNPPLFMNNIVTNSSTIRLFLIAPDPSEIFDYKIQYNVITNTQVAKELVYSTRTRSFTLPYNYWGTDNSIAIRELIYDFRQAYYHGHVSFSPYLLEPSFTSAVADETNYNLNVITGNVVWNTAQTITSNLWIQSGASLTIGPGVEVSIDAQKGILVDGELKVLGSETLPVTLKQSGSEAWGGIKFTPSAIMTTYNNTNGFPYIRGSIFSHVTISGAVPVSTNEASISAQYTTGVLMFDHVVFYATNRTGVYAEAVIIKNSNFDCTSMCIYTMSDTIATIVTDSVLNNKKSYLMKIDNIAYIRNNNFTGELAFTTKSGKDIQVTNNIINVQLYGARILSAQYVTFTNNVVNGGSIQALDIGMTGQSIVTISNNTFNNTNQVLRIQFTDSSSFEFSDNIVTDSVFGIMISGSNQYSGSVNILRNVFERMTGGIIETYSMLLTSVSDNNFVDSTSVDYYINYNGLSDFICWNNYYGEDVIDPPTKIYQSSIGAASMNFARTTPDMNSAIFISWNQTWTDNIYFNQDFEMIGPGKLTLDGATVHMPQDKFFTINSDVVAIGSKIQPVRFTTSAKSGTFGGVKILSGATVLDENNNYVSGSIFEFVQIDRADVALTISGTSLVVLKNVDISSCNRGIIATDSGIWLQSSVLTDASITVSSTNVVTKIVDNQITLSDSSTECSTTVTSTSGQLFFNGNIIKNSKDCRSTFSLLSNTTVTVSGNNWNGEGVYIDSELTDTGSVTVDSNTISGQSNGIEVVKRSSGVNSILRNTIQSTVGQFALKVTNRNNCGGSITVGNNTFNSNTVSENAVIVLESLLTDCPDLSVVFNYNSINNSIFNTVSTATKTLIDITGSLIRIQRNLLEHQHAYLLKYNSDNQIDATDNWFGSIYGDTIRTRIYDHRVDTTLGNINFIPYLLAKSFAATSDKQCSDQYSGSQCLNPVCWQLPSDHQSVCSSHGNCLSPNNCSCTYGFIGQACETLTCYSKSSSDSSVCSTRGVCTGVDQCSCYSGFSGNMCQTSTQDEKISFNIVSNLVGAIFNRRVMLRATAFINPTSLLNKMDMNWKLFRNGESVDLTSIVFDTSMINSRSIALKENSLSAGSIYTLVFNVKYKADTEYSSKGIRIQTSTPPVTGSFTFSPSQGTALSTQFTFNVNNWKTSDNSTLKFTFGYRDSDSNAEFIITPYSTNNQITTKLPAGELVLFAIGQSSIGDQSRVEKPIVVSEIADNTLFDTISDETILLTEQLDKDELTEAEIQSRITTLSSTVTKSITKLQQSQGTALIDSIMNAVSVSSSQSQSADLILAQIKNIKSITNNIAYVSNAAAQKAANILKNALNFEYLIANVDRDTVDLVTDAAGNLAQTMMSDKANQTTQIGFITLVDSILNVTKEVVLESQTKEISMNNIATTTTRTTRSTSPPKVKTRNPRGVSRRVDDADDIEISVSASIYETVSNMQESGSLVVQVAALKNDIYLLDKDLIAPVVTVNMYNESSAAIEVVTGSSELFNSTVPVRAQKNSTTEYQCRYLNPDTNKWENDTTICATYDDESNPGFVTCGCTRPVTLSVTLDYIQVVRPEETTAPPHRKSGLSSGAIAGIVIAAVSPVLIIIVVALVFAIPLYQLTSKRRSGQVNDIEVVERDN
jgi:hypothetical protein